MCPFFVPFCLKLKKLTLYMSLEFTYIDRVYPYITWTIFHLFLIPPPPPPPPPPSPVHVGIFYENIDIIGLQKQGGQKER